MDDPFSSRMDAPPGDDAQITRQICHLIKLAYQNLEFRIGHRITSLSCTSILYDLCYKLSISCFSNASNASLSQTFTSVKILDIPRDKAVAVF